MEKSKIVIIEGNAVVFMQIGKGYYDRVVNHVDELLKTNCSDTEGNLDLEKLNAVYKQIQDNNITESWITDLETCYIFISSFNEAATKAGFVRDAKEEEL